MGKKTNRTRSVQRTCKELREQGILYDIRERWNPYSHIRQDGHGFIDVEALWVGRGIVGIQCCGTDLQPHIRKITGKCAERATAWLRCKGIIEVWAWRKLKEKRGGKRMVWRLKIVPVTLEDFE